MIETKIHYPINNITLYFLILFTFIMGEDILGINITIAAILLSFAGLIVSRTITNSNKNKIVNILMDTANTIAGVWIIMSIMHSSFMLEKIITSFVKGIVFIIAILSFNPAYKRNGIYIQLLTLLLFMLYPLLFKTNTYLYQSLAAIYITIWIITIRISLQKQSYSSYLNILKIAILCILVMLIVLPFAYILKSHIYFPKLKQFSAVLKANKSDIEDNLYKLQDKLYKESKELGGKYNPGAGGNSQAVNFVSKKREAEGRITNFLSSLFQESPYVTKVEKARKGLKDIFHRPGLGLKEGNKEAFISDLKKYVDTKIKVNNLRRISRISNEIRSSSKSLKSKLSSLITINKINHTDSVEKAGRGLSSLNKFADSLPDSQNKTKLRKTIDELKMWKLYSIYNKSRDSIENVIENLSKTGNSNKMQDKKYISDLLSFIENAETPLDIIKLMPQIKSLNTELRNIDKGMKKNIIDNFREMIKSKIELSLNENLDILADELSQKSIPYKTIDKISTQMKNIIDSDSPDALLKRVKMLNDESRETEISKLVLNNIHTQNIIIGKIALLKDKEEAEINKLLNKSMLPKEKITHIIKSINNIFYSKYTTADSWHKLEEKMKKLSYSGEIYKDTYKKLKNTLYHLYIINRVRKSITSQKQKSSEDNNEENIWNKLIINISDENIRSSLNYTMNKLKSARHIQNVDIAKNILWVDLDKLKENNYKNTYWLGKYQTRVSVSEGIVSVVPYDKNGPHYEKEIILKAGESATVKGSSKTIQQRKGLVKKAKYYVNTISQMRKKAILTERLVKLIINLENLKSINQHYKNRISPILHNLQEIYTEGKHIDKKLIDKIENLYLDMSIDSHNKKQYLVQHKEWEVFAFPDKLLLNRKTTGKVKVIGIYNHYALKDITKEITWKFSNPNIAWIDRNGIIHPISTGTTKAFAVYKGNITSYIEITVVKELVK